MGLVLIGTGGTIASRSTRHGATASVRAHDLLETLTPQLREQFRVKPLDLQTAGSFALTLDDMLAVATTAVEHAGRSSVEGVVVTHGTDSLEETAFLTDLLYGGRPPIVFTGAQRTFDAPLPDGPDNLALALRTAASRSMRDRGVLVAFQGAVLRATGVRKHHTWDLHAFRGDDTSTGDSNDRSTLDGAMAPITGPMPTVACVLGVPGADGSAVRDAISHGPDGLVFQGTGIGNASPGDANVLAEAVSQGIPVLVTTRVAAGPTRPIYGNGGGKTLQDSGAVLAGELSTAQARVLLALCLVDTPPTEALQRAERWISRHATVPTSTN